LRKAEGFVSVEDSAREEFSMAMNTEEARAVLVAAGRLAPETRA
jgi:hypothetical protein